MIPSAAITAVCGIGSTRSAQIRAMPRAHAQFPYFRSVSTASLASWGVGIVAQEASMSDRTPITIRPDLTAATERIGPALIVRVLQPAAHTGLVIPIGIVEPPFQVRLLARDDAVADRDCQRQREDQDPWASCGYTDAAVDEKEAEIDGIAGPTVNAGRHQRAGGLVRGYGSPGPGEVPNTRGEQHQTDEDHRAGAHPVDGVSSRNGERPR